MTPYKAMCWAGDSGAEGGPGRGARGLAGLWPRGGRQAQAGVHVLAAPADGDAGRARPRVLHLPQTQRRFADLMLYAG